MKKNGSVLFLMLIVQVLKAQTISPMEYVEQFKGLAISEMKRMGVPAAVTLAQGILETESGNSMLLKKSNNHFGIKCKSSWTSSVVSHDDDATGECFRQYKSAEDSYRDHSNFLRGSDRYAFLFKLAADDYRGWAYGLKKAGYATNTRYPEILIKNIEQYNLNQYTLSAMGDIPKYDASAFEDDKEVPGTPETPQKENIVSESVTMLDQEDKVIGINGCKAVMGKKGVSLLVIALKNNVDLNKLLRFNELAEDGMLMNDQPVFLEKKAKTGEKDFHLVQKGESLYDISQKNGIQLQYLLDYNKLTNKDYPAAGSALWLKPLAALKEIPQKIQKKGIHIVQEKEGLYSIAKKYNVSMKQLKDWNKLVSDDLKMGMELRVAE